ncbi:MAG: hypothetical protein IPN46_13995 [Saprospiraceae bacterium]|nr:hypothetical protein [Saprospiraceae bacterium]
MISWKNIVGHKPVYSDDLPDWAKMLYQYPINYNELKAQYDLYVAQNGKVKNSYTRYFKNWSRIVSNFADPQGVIHVENLDKVRYTRTQNGARSGRLESTPDLFKPFMLTVIIALKHHLLIHRKSIFIAWMLPLAIPMYYTVVRRPDL